MRLYVVETPFSDDPGRSYTWHGTKDQAAKHSRKSKGSSFKAVEVPTKKADLIAFLNKMTEL